MSRQASSQLNQVPKPCSTVTRHPAPMFAYILEGEVTVDYGASGQRVYRKGDALMEAMHVPHRGMNLGTATVSILTVHMGAEGTANVTLEK